ncbi:MAG: hypothetical protein M1829_002030 [Trizodia sp. TS-e1964]|nr:MAG: hypothetical protein M1829_002030 [Trizodia sp. TS-e1964]
MAPRARALAPLEDNRTDEPPAKDKHLTAKGRHSAPHGSSNLAASSKDAKATALGSTAAASSNSNAVPENGPGISWTSFDTAVLHAYRQAYRLNTPSAFSNSFNRVVLSNRGIGRYSPTMARIKSRRRVSKEQLALSVRKNFNCLAITESEVIVDFIYKAKCKDKEFRMRFGAQRPR